MRQTPDFNSHSPTGRFRVGDFLKCLMQNSNRFAELLQEELVKRKQTNPQYSLRAFAKNLKIDAAALSRVIRGKQSMGASSFMKVCQALTISDLEKEELIRDFVNAKVASLIDKYK